MIMIIKLQIRKIQLFIKHMTGVIVNKKTQNGRNNIRIIRIRKTAIQIFNNITNKSINQSSLSIIMNIKILIKFNYNSKSNKNKSDKN